MRYFVGISMGLISGLILYFMLALFAWNPHASLPGWVLPIGFLGGWLVSSWLFIRNTTTAGRVASRAFLIGAGEWILMIPAGLVSSGRSVAETASGSTGQFGSAEAAGAAIGGGLSFILIAVMSVVFAFACVIGYAVTKNMGGEFQAERIQTKRCPDCAEAIQLEARKCRFCGAEQPAINAAVEA